MNDLSFQHKADQGKSRAGRHNGNSRIIKNRPIRILLVEDNPGDARLIKEFLSDESVSEKFLLSHVDRLERATARLSGENFDVILLDLSLPDSHGLDTVGRIYEKATLIPIVVLTGFGDEGLGVKAVHVGAQDYLVKGDVNGPSLVRAIRYAIERKQMEEKIIRYTEHLEEEVRSRTYELIQAEKMSALGQLVAGVAHEVNNPLAYIKSNTQFIGKKVGVLKKRWKGKDLDLDILDEISADIKINIDGINRIAKITQTLKRFARPDIGGKEPGDVIEGIKDTIVIVYNRIKNRIEIHEDHGEVPKFMCNIGQLNQVFMNLILNASQSMDKGDIWIRTWRDERKVYIEFKDNGCGIPADQIHKIFNPFFTTKDTGTGLGLSICYRIIKDHRGEIKVSSEVGIGTVMTIILPMEAE